jgi:hypothetical protein
MFNSLLKRPVVAKNSAKIDFTCTDSIVFIFSARPGLTGHMAFFSNLLGMWAF